MTLTCLTAGVSYSIALVLVVGGFVHVADHIDRSPISGIEIGVGFVQIVGGIFIWLGLLCMTGGAL